MKDKIIQTLQALRAHALTKAGLDVNILLHEEDSYLMRFANSAISLNTNERLIRLEITAYDGAKRASYEMITDLNKLDEIKAGIDSAAEMVQHAQPLNYQPTIATFTETFVDDSAYDPALATISNEERLTYFNQAVKGLETEEIRLGGIFSSGSSTIAQINTRSEHYQLFRWSDAQITVVLAHSKLKWEVIAEQSAQNMSDLDPESLRNELAFLLDKFLNEPQEQLPVGTYDIVFGPDAIGNMIGIMNWIGFNGGMMKRGYSFLTQEQVGKQVFSEKFTLLDDPECLATYPYKRDLMGMTRKTMPLFEKGAFKGFIWSQDDADEFGAQPTGHTVLHRSLSLQPGEQDVHSLEELVKTPRERDVLYIPYLHYMNIVNPSKGVITASSRFGALLLKAGGSIVVPYNVRITQSLYDLFGEKVAWLSRQTVAQNRSQSYGARNPAAVMIPKFMRVNGLEISHSNASF